ncbi:MAG: serine--tRNA ligase [Candidatus Omnitrophica bacterium]|nr:serine--tRNA ligase [Candidatus Omnitrophota bacterium]MCM8778007.1 serine--tRNA ligase [Candidatus Omnitrophota bacterium]
MYSAKFVRDNLELLKKACELKGAKVNWEELEKLDNERRRFISFIEERRKWQKDITSKIAERKDMNETLQDMIKQARKYSDEIREAEAKLKEIEKNYENIVASIPNIPHPSVPVGKDSSGNVVVKEWREIEKKDFDILPHWEIGEKLDILDFPRGAKITGSFFPVFKGNGAALVRGLINFMIELHKKNGFKEVWVPALVNRDSMFSTGQLPKLEKDMYHLDEEDYFLIPTAEVPVTNLHRDEVIPEDKLPLYYTAYTPCFRREAGAYGKDTKGLIRLHQFDKVELVKFVHPDTSYSELETLVEEAERVLQALNLPYRVVMLCTGDLSFAASKCYDIELWAPGIKKWLEVSSCSNFEAFQARRAGIRFRDKKHGRTEYVHTLNGSGVALPRLIISILENYQQPDGSVLIPDVLRQYTGIDVIK